MNFSFPKIGQGHLKGFSLVEMLVYISVLVIVAGGALTLLFSLNDRVAQQRAHQLVTRSAQSTLERMLADIRSADTIDIDDSVLTTNPGTLILFDGPTSTQYSETNDAVVVAIDGGSATPLSDSSVSVDELRFFYYDNTVAEMVRVVLTVSATVGEFTVTETFNASAALRGSYE